MNAFICMAPSTPRAKLLMTLTCEMLILTVPLYGNAVVKWQSTQAPYNNSVKNIKKICLKIYSYT